MAGTTGAGGRGGRRTAIVGINVTPMVDVVLVLLVIMMVSATYIVSRSLRVDLPRTSSADGAAASTAQVTITRDRRTLYNADAVTEPQLVDRLRRAHEGNPEISLIISGDREATHGAVVHVMDLARGVGITRFAINVERAQ